MFNLKVKYMENVFGYKCPVDWSEVPDHINFVTLQLSSYEDGQETIDMWGHESHPFCTSENYKIEWQCDHDSGTTYFVGFSPDKSANLMKQYYEAEIKVLKDLFVVAEDENPISFAEVQFGKCIWQRPQQL